MATYRFDEHGKIEAMLVDTDLAAFAELNARVDVFVARVRKAQEEKNESALVKRTQSAEKRRDGMAYWERGPVLGSRF